MIDGKRVRIIIATVRRVRVALRQELLRFTGCRLHVKRREQCSSRISNWPEIRGFLSSYGGNPGIEGNYMLFHRVMWKMKKQSGKKGTSEER